MIAGLRILRDKAASIAGIGVGFAVGVIASFALVVLLLPVLLGVGSEDSILTFDRWLELGFIGFGAFIVGGSFLLALFAFSGELEGKTQRELHERMDSLLVHMRELLAETVPVCARMTKEVVADSACEEKGARPTEHAIEYDPNGGQPFGLVFSVDETDEAERNSFIRVLSNLRRITIYSTPPEQLPVRLRPHDMNSLLLGTPLSTLGCLIFVFLKQEERLREYPDQAQIADEFQSHMLATVPPIVLWLMQQCLEKSSPWAASIIDDACDVDGVAYSWKGMAAFGIRRVDIPRFDRAREHSEDRDGQLWRVLKMNSEELA